MKKLILALAVVAVLPATAFADTFVHGYVKRDGTYVQPHMRSDRDGYSSNNWSTQGNVNPYTGSTGTKPNTDYYTGSSNSWGSSSYNSQRQQRPRCTGYFC